MKKINKYLLENHPLIWNTKIVWMSLVLIGAHLIFYCMGFFSFQNVSELNTYSLFNRYINSNVVLIGVLFSILIFILWLNSYFKQNAFKSFYPKSNKSLFMEFVWIFIICFMNISFYFSYTEGLRKSVSNSITTEELQHEVDIVNKAKPFTLERANLYHTNRCVSVPAFDSLVSHEEVAKLYVENQVRDANNYSGYASPDDYGVKWKDVNPDDYLLYKDSIPLPYYTNDEYTTLLMQHFPKRIHDHIGIIAKESGEDEETTVEYDYSNYSVREALNSLYNSCHSDIINFDSTKDSRYYALFVADLLQNCKKEELEKVLDDYLLLADKYKTNYWFKDKKWIDYVYNPPYYFVDYDLKTSEIRINNTSIPKDYVENYSLTQCMNTLIESKSNVIPVEVVLVLLYLALFASILIYAFRITSRRIWLMSFVGAIVLAFVFSAIYALISSIGNVGYPEDSVLFGVQALAFILTFWIFTLYCIRKEKFKKVSGMFLNFCILCIPTIIPLITFGYWEYLESMSYYYLNEYNERMYYHPHYEWLNAHIPDILFFNLGLFFVVLFSLTPLIKKWKSLPEE